MKLSNIGLLLALFTLSSCASGYKMINPSSLNYVSTDTKNDVKLEYKYDVLQDKYARKETNRGINVVAIKVTNNTDRDLVFGQDIKLAYENGNEFPVVENEKVFESLKQSTGGYLLYLLLTPMKLNVQKAGEEPKSTPIGYGIGPGLAGINMLTSSTANSKFETELLEFDINGATIKKGETKTGLVGIRSNNYASIKIKMD